MIGKPRPSPTCWQSLTTSLTTTRMPPKFSKMRLNTRRPSFQNALKCTARAGATLVFNEIDPFRQRLLRTLFGGEVTGHDGEHIDNLLQTPLPLRAEAVVWPPFQPDLARSAQIGQQQTPRERRSSPLQRVRRQYGSISGHPQQNRPDHPIRREIKRVSTHPRLNPAVRRRTHEGPQRAVHDLGDVGEYW